MGSKPKSMKIFKEMRKTNEEAKEALQHDGDPEVCDDRTPKLPDRGKGTLSERTSEISLTGVLVMGCPVLLAEVTGLRMMPETPDRVELILLPPLSRNARAPIIWTLR